MTRHQPLVSVFLGSISIASSCASPACVALAQTPSVQTRSIQSAPATLPAGTPLPLRLPDHLRMKVGEPVRATLMYPVFVNDQLVLPANTVISGSILSLSPDPKRRTRARLGGDFTPFHTPVLQFTSVLLPDGTAVPITTPVATDGAPIYRALDPPKQTGSLVHRGIESALTVARSDLAVYIAPGKLDRLQQFLYNRLPYHPERIEANTAWTTTLAVPAQLPAQAPVQPLAPIRAAPASKPRFWEVRAAPVSPPLPDQPGQWTIEAFLDEPISSESSKAGQPIHATVARPVLAPDGSVAIAQGSRLDGTVSLARAARRFSRTGVLSFNFNQLTTAGAQPQNVQTSLIGADLASGIALNSEGQAKASPKDKLSLPIALAILAARPLHHEHGDNDGGAGKNATAGAAGLGLIGSIVGLSGVSPYAAAGIGYYGTALATYDRWIAPGKQIIFPRNTRIVVRTIARRSAPMQATPVSAP